VVKVLFLVKGLAAGALHAVTAAGVLRVLTAAGVLRAVTEALHFFWVAKLFCAGALAAIWATGCAVLVAKDLFELEMWRVWVVASGAVVAVVAVDATVERLAEATVEESVSHGEACDAAPLAPDFVELMGAAALGADWAAMGAAASRVELCAAASVVTDVYADCDAALLVATSVLLLRWTLH